jgi:Trypsin-like serine proteases, typically periplasmic, contain C-terminal PDZ domain
VGIRYEMIDAKVKAEKHLTVDEGALISPATDTSGAVLPAIAPDSPAAAAGLADEDIITAIEGQAVDGEHPLDAILSGYAPGQTVKLTVLRGTQQMTISVTLGTRPPKL